MYWKKMVPTLPMKIWTHCKFTSCFVPTGELRLWGRQWGPQLRRDSCLQARECEQCLLWERQPDAWEKTSAIGRRLRVKGHEIEKQSQKSEESNHLQGWFPHKSHQVLMEKHRKCFSNTSLVRHTWGKRISNHGGAKIPSGNFLPLQLSKWKQRFHLETSFLSSSPNESIHPLRDEKLTPPASDIRGNPLQPWKQKWN